VGRRFGRSVQPYAVVIAAAGAVLALAACGSSSNNSSSSSSGGSVNWSTATSAQAGGGMSALIAAAKKEGHLNVITLPANWANYGTQMKEFTQMYGIKIHDAIPSGSSAQEIQAIETGRGSSTAPDVVDVGQSFALQDAALFAPYKVASWSMIPTANKDPQGRWFNDYGGFMSFGCNLNVLKSCPTSWSQLTQPAYKNAVALNGIPGQAGAATNAVQAAAVNNGGSLSNAQPGLTFFKKLQSMGNFNKTDCDSGSLITAGQCPLIINWDYLNAAGAWGLPSKDKWKVVLPQGQPWAAYYAQAISKTAPDPAAARLWEEFLYSAQGQNNFLKGYARPVEMAAMQQNGSIDKAAAAALPPVSTPMTQYPTNSDLTAAGKLIAAGWSS
jgi:putative spermidine/putrescine transport system substrate-binding protein